MTFMTGIPPATEASRPINNCFFFAIEDNSIPYLAIKALLAVIKAYYLLSVLKARSFATPSSPPINSITKSILSSSAKLRALLKTFKCLDLFFSFYF